MSTVYNILITIFVLVRSIFRPLICIVRIKNQHSSGIKCILSVLDTIVLLYYIVLFHADTSLVLTPV
jgi:CBS-domain-containing membrane protein